jgi:hypothetical protein
MSTLTSQNEFKNLLTGCQHRQFRDESAQKLWKQTTRVCLLIKIILQLHVVTESDYNWNYQISD